MVFARALIRGSTEFSNPLICQNSLQKVVWVLEVVVRRCDFRYWGDTLEKCRAPWSGLFARSFGDYLWDIGDLMERSLWHCRRFLCGFEWEVVYALFMASLWISLTRT